MKLTPKKLETSAVEVYVLLDGDVFVAYCARNSSGMWIALDSNDRMVGGPETYRNDLFEYVDSINNPQHSVINN